MIKHNLRLPDSLRSALKEPMGKLIEGTQETTKPELKQYFQSFQYWLVTVGDVITDIMIELGIFPSIIVTDGQTKREKLEEWKSYDKYTEIEAHCPAATITAEAWNAIIRSIKMSKKGSLVHIKIIGEEDLLVLPFITELDLKSVVVYGQPNRGAVIREVDAHAKSQATELLRQMEKY